MILMKSTNSKLLYLVFVDAKYFHKPYNINLEK